MKLKKSVVLAMALAGAVVSTLLVAVGIGLATGAWFGALVAGLGVGAGVGAVGVALARVNDRTGDLLAAQRRSQAQSDKADKEIKTALSTLKPPPPPKPAPPPAPLDPGVVALRALMRIPKTPVGTSNNAGATRFPISTDDLPEWKHTRTTGERPLLTSLAPSWAPEVGVNPAAVPVAMIADEFTYQSFAPEFQVYRLHPDTWRETMEKAQPALFFCESAWSGGAPPERPWAAQIYATVRWAQERRQHLFEILAYCRKKGIPTVFWNKEDPIHFTNRINDFVRTAALFDVALTTAEECVELYQRDAGVEHAYALPFAVQPTLFNPLGARSPRNAAVFAGTWYDRYPQRTAALSRIMDLVVSSGRDMVIYDRQFNVPSGSGYDYPERYQKYRRPAIPYERTADAYRANLFGITLNTITDSRTMFARRVFEMAACGQAILSNTALGVEEFFGDSVIYADREPERFLALDDAETARLRKEALHVALRNTYAHRAVTILDSVGITAAPVEQAPTLAVVVRTIDDYERARRHASDAFGHLLCLVADDAEEGLLLTLSRRHDPGVSVEVESRVRSGEIRSRGLLPTRAVLFVENGELPGEEWVRTAQLHLSYADLPIVPGNTRGIALERLESSGAAVSLMTAELFDRHVCAGEPVAAVYSL